MSLWMQSEGDPLVLTWTLLPGLDLVVFRLAGRLSIHYVLGPPGEEIVIRTREEAELEDCRAIWRLSFTRGEA